MPEQGYDGYKHVYFHDWCTKCKYEKKPESEEPCFHCLDNPIALHSHKPVEWKEKPKK